MAAPILMRLRDRLEKGIRLPRSRLRLSVRVRADQAHDGHEVLHQTLEHLLERFSDLRRFVHSSVANDPVACAAALDFVHDYLPLIYEPARETQLRRLLVRLRNQIGDDDYKLQLTREIALSDLRSGVPERATSLLGADVPPETASKLKSEIELFEQRYQARAGLITSLETWRSIPGDVRGQSLVAYFGSNREAIRGKRILHVAPEATLRAWIQEEAPSLGIEYLTLDPFSSEVDLKENLTHLPLSDSSFDLVICHRVMEHILDDQRALREIQRILKPEGVLNFSVPQSMNLDTTNEWVVPDTSHDHHVRQYGADLEARIRKAGFARVEVERFLLDRTREEHIAAKTYPLRIYLCFKTPRVD